MIVISEAELRNCRGLLVGLHFIYEVSARSVDERKAILAQTLGDKFEVRVFNEDNRTYFDVSRLSA